MFCKHSRVAILDLGTNTFHLLIVEIQGPGRFKELLRDRRFIRLARSGIETIDHQSIALGMAALKDYKDKIEKLGVHHVKAVGTAALRTADNGPTFMSMIKVETGIDVEVIDGNEEANLIYRGVKQIWNKTDLPALIMDIGGGSVEFILADHRQIYWSRSYPIGVAILMRDFHHNEPIAPKEIESLQSYLDPMLSEVSRAIAGEKPSTLIGASGTFDVLLHFLASDQQPLYYQSTIEPVQNFLSEIVVMDREARSQDPRIPQSRVDMIVVAALLIQQVLTKYPFQRLGISQYALKEGLIF